MKAGHPSDRRRRWPTEGDRNRGGLDSFASVARYGKLREPGRCADHLVSVW